MARARAASDSDAQRCAELCRDALEAMAGQRGGALLARREAGLLAEAFLGPGGLRRLTEDPRRLVLVGCADDGRGAAHGGEPEEVVGFAVGRVEPVGEASLGVVDALYVDPARRARGVGGGLLGALVEWFEESGCTGVDASALPGDRETKSFFEGAGFKARLLTMHRTFEARE